MAKREINVCIKNGEVPLPLEILESEIIKLANVGKKIVASRLKQRAIILLLHDATKVSKGQIESILDALPQLEKKYLK